MQHILKHIHTCTCTRLCVSHLCVYTVCRFVYILERKRHVVPQRSSNVEGGASLHRRVLAAASGEALGEGARRQTDAGHAQDSARTGNTEASTGKCRHVM